MFKAKLKWKFFQKNIKIYFLKRKKKILKISTFQIKVKIKIKIESYPGGPSL